MTMGIKFSLVEIVEFETTSGAYAMVYGKGRRNQDLVYFQLDATFLRQPEEMYVGGQITVTDDEVTGTAEGYFQRSFARR